MGRKNLFNYFSGVTLFVFMLVSVAAHAEDYTIVIKDNQFSPQELVIPANRKVKITVKNLDATPAEFESYDLNREKIVGANSDIILFIGPLEPGSYAYFDDFHRETTKGTMISK